MTLLQLRYIVKIVECGSMNEASHALYVSQPALSSSVKELENELGIEIFTRSSQGIALTVDGAEFLTYARQVLDKGGSVGGTVQERETAQAAVLRLHTALHVRGRGLRRDDQLVQIG